MLAQLATLTIHRFVKFSRRLRRALLEDARTAGEATLDPAGTVTFIDCVPKDIQAIGDRYGFERVIQYGVLTFVNQNSRSTTRHSEPGRSRCPSPCMSGAATETGT